VPWGIHLWSEFGQLFPNAAYAKAGSFELSPGSVARLIGRQLGLVGATSAAEALAIAAAMFVALVTARDRIGPFLRRFALPAAWMLALPLLYAVRGSVLVSRYLIPSLCLVTAFGFAALDYLRGSWRGSRGPSPGGGVVERIPWIAAAAILVQNLLVLYLVALPSALSFTRGLRESLVYIGEWARRETDPAATLAVPDIGAIGYISQRKVIDLSGHVTPEMIPARKGETLEDFIAGFGFAEVARPDYLIDRHTVPDRFASLPGYDGVLELLFVREIGPLGIRRSDDYFYSVYRVHWDRFDATRAPGGRPLAE
jgi:hypothetical protein